VHTDGLSPLQYRRRVFVEQMKIALHAGVSARAAGELWLDMTPEGARKLFGAVVGMSPIAWRRLYAGAPVEERIVASEDIAWRLVVREGWMRVAWAEGPADQRRLIRPLPRDAHAGETTILTPDGAQHHVGNATNE
jgi:hypothetical protein